MPDLLQIVAINPAFCFTLLTITAKTRGLSPVNNAYKKQTDNNAQTLPLNTANGKLADIKSERVFRNKFFVRTHFIGTD